MLIEELEEKLKGSGALIGLDLGTKTIGVAVSDVEWHYATPLTIIERRKFSDDVQGLRKLISERKVVGIILGLPLNMDGSEGPRAQSTRAFARNLEKHIDLPLSFWDERLSTREAERAMIEADLPRQKRKQKIDAAAAAVILQAALDRLRFIRA